MIRLALLAFRLSRFELLAATMIVGLLAVGAVLIRGQFDGIGVPDGCFDEWLNAFGALTARCDGPINAWFDAEQRATNLLTWIGIVPFAAGVVVGVPLVGRELELGTAPMAWSVAPSRWRWLVARLGPFMVYMVVVVGLLAVATEILWLGRTPWEPRVRFDDVSLHGPPVLARSIAALGIGAVTGTVIGRTLPAAILAVGLTFAVVVGSQLSYDAWLDAEAHLHVIVLDATSPETAEALFPGGTAILTGWVDPGGTFFDDQAAAALAPAGTADPYQWLSEHFRPAVRGVPAEQFPVWVALETTGFSLIALVALVGLFPVVARRRPL